MITVNDAEKLAKAGVAMSWDAIQPFLYDSDDCRPAGPSPGERPMADAIWERWARAKLAHANSYYTYDGQLRPWQLFAAAHKDTVHVFVAPSDGEPFVLTDVAAIFPSDALMASLALHDRTK